MTKRKQTNIRLDGDEIAMITWLQRNMSSEDDKVPSMTQVIAKAVREKYEREFVPVMGKKAARR